VAEWAYNGLVMKRTLPQVGRQQFRLSHFWIVNQIDRHLELDGDFCTSTVVACTKYTDYFGFWIAPLLLKGRKCNQTLEASNFVRFPILQIVNRLEVTGKRQCTSYGDHQLALVALSSATTGHLACQGERLD
jgi:hypothetical protein